MAIYISLSYYHSNVETLVILKVILIALKPGWTDSAHLED